MIGDSDLAGLLQAIAADESVPTEVVPPDEAQERMAAGTFPETVLIDGGLSPRARSRLVLTAGRVVELSAGPRRPSIDGDRPAGMTLLIPAPLREMQRAIRWLAWEGDQVEPSVDMLESSSRA